MCSLNGAGTRRTAVQTEDELKSMTRETSGRATREEGQMNERLGRNLCKG